MALIDSIKFQVQVRIVRRNIEQMKKLLRPKPKSLYPIVSLHLDSTTTNSPTPCYVIETQGVRQYVPVARYHQYFCCASSSGKMTQADLGEQAHGLATTYCI